MRKSRPYRSDSGGSSGSSRNSYEGSANDGRRGREEEVDEGEEVDGEGEEGNAEGGRDYAGERDEKSESFGGEDDSVEDRRQRGSKIGTDDVQRLLRRMKNKSDDSGRSADGSRASFDESLDNRNNMKTLKSSVQDHELPLRIAYEQLEELAANAEKVKSAIEKNRSILNVQVKKSNSRYLRAAFAAWKLEFDWQKRKKRDIIRADTWRKKFLMLHSFRAWSREHMVNGKVRRLEKSVFVITQRHNLRRCWKEKRLVKDLDSKYQEQICRRACNFMYRWRLRRILLAFKDGCEINRLESEWEKGMVKNLIKKKLKRLHQGWRRVTKESNNIRAFLQTVIDNQHRRVITILQSKFDMWISSNKAHVQLQAQQKMVRLQEHVVTVEKENDRLRVENKRLAHVIDSGNWGKERISELVQAGQVLTGERDALTRLLGRMQRQHSFALDQQRQHEEEVQELKRQLMGKKHLVRNKLLVKEASSFNSLVKAMKDDVLKNGNNPEVLYTIDKLAMDEVTVFPDGDLRVKPIPNFDKGKGTWSSRHTSPASNPQAHSSQPIQPAAATPVRPSTPMKSARARTPVKSRSGEHDVTVALALSAVTVKPASVTPMYVRAKTPVRGCAVDLFDYDQKSRNSENDGPARIRNVDREVAVKTNRDLGLHQKYPNQVPPTPMY